MAEKYDLNQIRREESKRIDISIFLGQPEGTVFIEVRRYTTKQKAILLDLYKAIEQEDPNKTIEQIEQNAGGLTEAMATRSVLYGINDLADDFPFEGWSLDFLRKINERNSELFNLLKEEVTNLNVPLAKEKLKESL